MPKILVMDDEPLSLRRLYNLLCDARQHEISTAESLPAAVRVVERTGASLDLLIIDVSMFETMAIQLLELFTAACPQAKILVITPRLRHTLAGYAQLLKPFTLTGLLDAVNQVLGMRRGIVVEPGARPKPPSRADHRLPRARASAR